MITRFTRLDAIDRLMDNSDFIELFRCCVEGRLTTAEMERKADDMIFIELESLEDMEAESRGELRRHLNVEPAIRLVVNGFSRSRS